MKEWRERNRVVHVIIKGEVNAGESLRGKSVLKNKKNKKYLRGHWKDQDITPEAEEDIRPGSPVKRSLTYRRCQTTVLVISIQWAKSSFQNGGGGLSTVGGSPLGFWDGRRLSKGE